MPCTIELSGHLELRILQRNLKALVFASPWWDSLLEEVQWCFFSLKVWLSGEDDCRSTWCVTQTCRNPWHMLGSVDKSASKILNKNGIPAKKLWWKTLVSKKCIASHLKFIPDHLVRYSHDHGMTWWQKSKSFVFECGLMSCMRGLSMHHPCWGWTSRFLKDPELRGKKKGLQTVFRGHVSFNKRAPNMETERWKTVLFSTEKKFKLHGPDGFQNCWHQVCVLTAEVSAPEQKGAVMN